MKLVTRIVALAVLLCAGCISLKVDEAQLAEMHTRGSATLEPSSQDEKASVMGPRLRRFYAAVVDLPVGQKGGFNQVYELAAGVRHVVIAVYVQDPRFGGYDLKSAGADVTFEARAGASYRVDGRINGESADLWVTDMAAGEKVTERSPSVSN